MVDLTDQSSFFADDDEDGAQDADETVYYDLTNNKDDDPTTGSEAQINGALFFTDQPDSSSGTGVIQAFVRLQDGGNDDTPGFENGYNTDARPVYHEENTSPSFTTNLFLSAVPIVEIDGVQYYEFRLDINQLNSSPLLSLDALQLYTSDVADGDVLGPVPGVSWNGGAPVDETGTSFDDNTTLVYDLDGAGDASILLNYSLQAGSGKSDMFFYVPVSNFGGANPETTLVTLYSEFGATNTLDASDNLVAIDDPTAADDGVTEDATSIYGVYTTNDGFEEWSVSKVLDDNFLWGYKWNDLDGDGVWDVGEAGEGGFVIDYEITYKDGNGAKAPIVTVAGSTTTSDGTIDVDGDGEVDPAGYYIIPVPLGAANNTTYTITLTERAREDWVNTYDGDATADRTTTFQFSENTLEDNPEAISGVFGEAVQFNFGNFELFDISGTKYIDSNGDGTISGTETTTLAGVTIFIDDDDSGNLSEGDRTTVTDENGNWSFTGLGPDDIGKSVYEDLTQGGLDATYYQTVGNGGLVISTTSGEDVTGLDFGNVEYGSIAGTKFEDADGDGDPADGDSGIPEWTISLYDGDPDNGGTLIDQTTTDENGDYSFDGLALGTYWLVEETREGWVNTTPVQIAVTGTGTSGFDITGQDFYNFELFDISGTKYIDSNGDGTISGTETTTLAGVTIFIDDDDSGDLSEGDRTTVTDENGNWSFTGLGPDDIGKSVYEDLTQGGLDATYYQTVGNGGLVISTTSGEDVTGLDFGNVEYGSIAGTKFEDADGDGDPADGDSGIPEWTISLYDGDPDNGGTLIDQTTTDENGDYSFDGLALGTYWLVEETREGWVNTTPVQIAVTGTGTSGFDITGQDFYNFELFEISGYKWADLDADGTWDEPVTAGLEGWTIVLDDDANPDNGFIASTTTAADGSYSFENLGPDSYGGALVGITIHVYELQQDGFTQTYDGGYTFTLTSGADYAAPIGEAVDGNFGNHMMAGANRTPGFWQSQLGSSFYDGILDNQGDSNGDGSPNGDKDYEEEGWSETDLLELYGVDLESNDGNADNVSDNDHFAIWDPNESGTPDEEGDIFLTPEELHEWVSGGEKGGGRDFVEILERDLGAAFLNSINNDAIGDDPGGDYAIDPDIADSYMAAIQFVTTVSGSKKDQKDAWNDYGSDAHNELSAFNESGEAMVEGEMVQILMDGDDYSSSFVQNYLKVEENIAAEESALIQPSIADSVIYDDMMLAQINAAV
ncbi:SdrD B-like domain [Altererythrobacter xiamenensis]|uniref:SdrD B-like domain n=1 Tax=Altererythrobacter xiamenensis TaxID=1316679 RepID=A0A1Y6FKQ0_9SPHN|nr:SdrD B-like domain-containing protein [Altererythrobacter xiamenensis]SMQ73402.1 SdrD B-like domain [Altererythrobacter xiamenensis]